MKKYVKAEMVAKNLASGSYAAGCPEKDYGVDWRCHQCERTK